MELDHNKLINVLKDIEKAADITILHASVIGAHETGLVRKDSNINILFIYADKLKKYFDISDHKQMVSIKYDNVELVAFSLKKALSMIASSSTTILNMLCSKERIISSLDFFKSLEDLAREYYNPNKTYRALLKASNHAHCELVSNKAIRIKIFLNYIRLSLALHHCSCYGLIENNFIKLVSKSKLSPTIKKQIINIVGRYKLGEDYIDADEIKQIVEAIEKSIHFTKFHYAGAPAVDYDKLETFHMKTILDLYKKNMYINY